MRIFPDNTEVRRVANGLLEQSKYDYCSARLRQSKAAPYLAIDVLVRQPTGKVGRHLFSLVIFGPAYNS